MYYADLHEDVPSWCGPDGKSLMCVLPDGHIWHVDGEAANCNRRGEPHKCWPRRGVPPIVTIGKSYGETCTAGAGSILSPTGWHGFLRDGVLAP
jgi:hypothetical protein